jgi:hypothetical protein
MEAIISRLKDGYLFLCTIQGVRDLLLYTIQDVPGFIVVYYTGRPGGKVNVLGGHSIGHSEQENIYLHVSYSERFPR